MATLVLHYGAKISVLQLQDNLLGSTHRQAIAHNIDSLPHPDGTCGPTPEALHHNPDNGCNSTTRATHPYASPGLQYTQGATDRPTTCPTQISLICYMPSLHHYFTLELELHPTQTLETWYAS